MSLRFDDRFKHLLGECSAIEGTRHWEANPMVTSIRYEQVDEHLLKAWTTKCGNLLDFVFGANNRHVTAFDAARKSSTSSWNKYKGVRSAFEAAYDDYQFGLYKRPEAIAQADVFDDELEQATDLLINGYAVAAAVIAGVVLETTLRKMCIRMGIEPSRLDRMNADLAKARVYSVLVQKQITAQAGVRNDAAHGQAVNASDVEAMIKYVARFVEEHLI